MVKKLFVLIIFLLTFFLSSRPILAVTDPISSPNNKFGIHIFSEKDLPDAANLVNSTGGDWGYVTIVITEGERDRGRWQQVFDQMRKLHLIPIIRLATKAKGNTWDAPQEAEIDNWVIFLNSLNWVTQNRYVVVNNEPNHAQEWGGRIDPAGYASYLKKVSQKLKSASPDFFVLPAGLDPSSSNTATTMTEDKFLYRALVAEPDVFDFIDGWTSHAYPNARIDIYEHELAVIKKKLPVFITETGWPSNKYSEYQISVNLTNAFINTWNDPRVIAVTPFILDYTNSPFDIYSWEKPDGTFYNFYNKVQSLVKIKGSPVQIESGQIMAAFAQPIIFTGTDFVGAILAKNTGQTIWEQGNVKIGNESDDFRLRSLSMNDIEPTRLGLIFFRAAEVQKNGIYINSLFLTGSKNQKITNGFSIEGAVVTLNKVQIQAFFGKILSAVHLGP